MALWRAALLRFCGTGRVLRYIRLRGGTCGSLRVVERTGLALSETAMLRAYLRRIVTARRIESRLRPVCACGKRSSVAAIAAYRTRSRRHANWQGPGGRLSPLRARRCGNRPTPHAHEHHPPAPMVTQRRQRVARAKTISATAAQRCATRIIVNRPGFGPTNAGIGIIHRNKVGTPLGAVQAVR